MLDDHGRLEMVVGTVGEFLCGVVDAVRAGEEVVRDDEAKTLMVGFSWSGGRVDLPLSRLKDERQWEGLDTWGWFGVSAGQVYEWSCKPETRDQIPGKVLR